MINLSSLLSTVQRQQHGEGCSDAAPIPEDEHQGSTPALRLEEVDRRDVPRGVPTVLIIAPTSDILQQIVDAVCRIENLTEEAEQVPLVVDFVYFSSNVWPPNVHQVVAFKASENPSWTSGALIVHVFPEKGKF